MRPVLPDPEPMVSPAPPNQSDWRRGWCPTGTRAMDTADGELLRIRPRLARLAADELSALARIAETHADGRVLLTRRGKLELRGIRDTAATVSALADAGLLEDEAHAALPDRLVSPASDIDDHAIGDAGLLAQAIDAELIKATTASPLSAKFALAIDGGGKAHIGTCAADIRLDAVPGTPGSWRVALAGTLDEAVVLGCVTAAQAPVVVRAILEQFMARPESIRRMRDLPAQTLRTCFQACLPNNALPGPGAISRPCSRNTPGLHDGGWLTAGFAFGRIPAPALHGLAALARESTTGDVRITRERAVMVSRTDEPARHTLHELGALLSPADARYPLVACIGRAGCLRGTTDTRADALRYSQAIPNLRAATGGVAIHVSGCGKGCARRTAALITLVGHNGCYDVIFNAGPGAEPVGCALAPETLTRYLKRLDRAFAEQGLANENAEAFLARWGQAERHHLSEQENTQ